jgi:rRNA-processing protein FCF1
MANVVLDTNALMMPFQFNIDLEAEIRRLLGAVEIFVPEACVHELDHIPDRRAAAARELSSRFKVMPSEGNGDDAVLSLASNLRAVIVTNDTGLRRRAKLVGLKVAYLRGKDHLALD